MSTLDYSLVDSLTSYGKFNLTLKEPPMTVIAVLREAPDSILIAADSQQLESDGMGHIRHSTDHKLQSHPTLPLVWAIKDNATIGALFSAWLKQLELPTATPWNALQEGITKQLSILNGKQRQLSQLAGVQLHDAELCGVLAAGFLGGVGSVFEVDARGKLGVKDEHEFHSIGSGFVHAEVAYKTLKRIQSEASKEEQLKTIVGIAAETAPSCGPPVHLARVTPVGVTLLG